ncbi:MAG: chromosome segregation protein SMC [Bdellovibrio sp.]|nr:MAG: chromosome segregation protein SMC [Bdellovibrio sp.]
MRIKKIELIGFKSFKDRTVIQFDAGITGIVGPNGCGKSNIVDALIWVMGEMSAKDLRGATMSDVIFAGAENYAPAGLAEVTLTLENDGGPFPAQYARHSEIMLTRRLHRSGESEYFINKEPARLRDIQEVFMDTGAGSKGFSIIAQGMIGKIITAKPEDRRMLIEEAAGITKFKARKRESQRKIQSTDQNLLRLADILGELKRQLDSLERQAQRAERYRGLKQQIEELDLWLSSRHFRDLKEAADQAQRIFQELQALETQSEAEVASLTAELETLQLGLVEQEKRVNELQSRQFDRQSALQKQELEMQSLKFEIEQARRSEQMAGSLLQEQRARRDLLTRDAQNLEASVQRLAEESSRLAAEVRIKNEELEAVQARIAEADEELTSQRRELFALGQTLSAIEGKLMGLQSQFSDLSEREENEKQILQELLEKKLAFSERRTRLQNDFERERQLQQQYMSEEQSLESDRKALTLQMTEKRAEQDEFKDKLNEVTSRLYGLENLQQNFEGFEAGVRNVMLWQKAAAPGGEAAQVGAYATSGFGTSADEGADSADSFQPVSEVVEVPADYEIAMEAALGSRLQLLLAPNEDRALEAVDYLKSQNSGRSSFYCQVGAYATSGFGTSAVSTDSARAESRSGKSASSPGVFPSLGEAPSGPGVECLLGDVVKANESRRQAISFLLDGVAVVDSLRSALQLRDAHPGWTFVTRDGDTLSAEGVLTGGSSAGAESGVLRRRREIKELTQQKNEWAGKLALVQTSLKKLEDQLKTVTQYCEVAQKRKMEQDIRVTELRKDVERAEVESENAVMASQRQERTVGQTGEQLNTLRSRIEEIEANVLETRRKKSLAEEKARNLEVELQTAKVGFDPLRIEVMDLQARSAARTQENQGLHQQLLMVQKQLEELDRQLGRMSEESAKNSTFASENEVYLEQKKIDFERGIQEVEDLKRRLAHSRDEYEQQSALVHENERQNTAALKERNERQHRMNESQIKFEQMRMKEQYLIDQVREKYIQNLPEIYLERAEREGDPAEAEKELQELREKVAKIGEVNLSAIEEFDETSKRHQFLKQQQDDLTEAKAQLHRVVDRINRICSKRFKETFDLVNERFTKVFPVLFGGGEARLEMSEDPDKGEQGIEIIARPPGKKMQNISLLSGGEKALTAVSLVFAIFLVKPSPYCLLDEVDAPLDDANVYRFNDLVREMSKRSQIIVVTHNKHTMEVAGKLYGVTMQERGVSTMVSVNLSDLRNESVGGKAATDVRAVPTA